MWIDVYDFDGTVYRGDSTIAFWWWCLRTRPALAKHLPGQLKALCMMALGRWDKTRGKGQFLCFLRDIDVSERAEAFWARPQSQRRMMPWFAPRQSELPVVIATASVEELIQPIARELGATHVIGTRVDLASGLLVGPNCRGQEKVERLHALLPGALVRATYTDNTKADAPILALAQQKFHVRGGKPQRIWTSQKTKGRI